MYRMEASSAWYSFANFVLDMEFKGSVHSYMKTAKQHDRMKEKIMVDPSLRCTGTA